MMKHLVIKILPEQCILSGYANKKIVLKPMGVALSKL